MLVFIISFFALVGIFSLISVILFAYDIKRECKSIKEGRTAYLFKETLFPAYLVITVLIAVYFVTVAIFLGTIIRMI